MAISEIPLLRHRNTVVTIEDQNDFVAKYEATNDHLAQVTVGEMNSTLVEINGYMNLIDQDMNAISTQVETIGGYVVSTRDYKDEAKGYASAAQTSYENTVNIIELADITGTAGYTMDVVDDMLSRQRNSQIVGLT